MKKGLFRKEIVIGILLLFVGAGVIPSTGTVVEKTTITDSKSGGYIQDLIDNASDGDTINIPSGSYYENIVIDKSISLIGENKNTTIIHNLNIKEHCVEIVADWVNISGFTILRYSKMEKFFPEGIYIDSANNIAISDNIISNKGGYGIYGYYSNDNVITDNLIWDNSDGIHLYKSKGNTITDNSIWKNYCGISIWSNCNNNSIYHNDFIYNYWGNADDQGNNTWDDGYPSGGNYWDDYNGTDNDGDGIGDTPYPIYGGDNMDGYPLIEPLGGKNQPPEAPIIQGPTTGKPGIEYNYTFVSIDPDGDDVCYYIDWKSYGDGFWTDWYASGEEVILPYSWPGENTFTISAKAKDKWDAESNWTYLDVEIETPRNKPFSFNFNLLSWLFERFPLLEKLLGLFR